MGHTPPLILASSSPRRAELLKALRYPFKVIPGPELDEHALLSEGSGGLPQRLQELARLKGYTVSRNYPDELVLSADTVVVLPHEIDLEDAEGQEYSYTAEVLGKPADEQAAKRMLLSLSGRMHHVITAVCLQREDEGLIEQGWEVTQVYFNALSERMVEHYIQYEQPYDKAGAYAIQGLGALLVSRIEGDYTNVVGLPLGLTARMLELAHIRVL
ncbi:MAG: Maf family protein [bacterium]|nr:Maf family protein [bacterium]